MQIFFTTIGQDSHRFKEDIVDEGKIVLAGVEISSDHLIDANSDGDVVYHAITNAISGATGVNILGKIADEICLGQGIKDSSIYLSEAQKYMKGITLHHISISIECLTPKLSMHMESMKENISNLLNIPVSHIGITATTGEGLTEFGRGKGIQVFVVASFSREE